MEGKLISKAGRNNKHREKGLRVKKKYEMGGDGVLRQVGIKNGGRCGLETMKKN